ncbi:hypothetical protein U8C32_15020 [Sinorhizobium medicae]|uniref:hypothetical protein n=1 Tax=Sinorhizobium medicae TaxID=110321 RepID=UPI002AF6A731|nr:hypothetical protein [Sinorhizobium medicae]WQO91118.1 hypothetical protein U8C32_15020 [Sinorhizobium medicae]
MSLSMIASPEVAAADKAEVTTAKALVGDGPYEIKGESGVFGYVVASSTVSVTFKPCSGDSFEVERKKLRRTKFKCGDAPSPDQNPLIVSCDDTDAYVGLASAAYDQKDRPIGTAYYLSSSGENTIIDVVAPEQMAAEIDDVKELRDCGRSVVGFGGTGKPLLQVIDTTDSLQITD